MKTHKEDLYKKEQAQLLNKLNDILNLKNNNFIFYELDNDEEKKKKILGLIEDIRKFYRYESYCSVINAKKNKWLVVMRFIFRRNGYSFYTKKYDFMKDNEKIKTVRYAVIKD